MSKNIPWLEIPLTLARRPGLMDEVQEFELSFKPLTFGLYKGLDDHIIWDNYQIDPVRVGL